MSTSGSDSDPPVAKFDISNDPHLEMRTLSRLRKMILLSLEGVQDAVCAMEI